MKAADAQRRRLERDIREGPERRLAHMAELLDECGPQLAGVLGDLDGARASCGNSPAGSILRSSPRPGLPAAVIDLSERAPVPIKVAVPAGRWPPTVEAAAYFVCAEALTNVAKYARASQVTASVEEIGNRLTIRVVDDGIGGANPADGSGLRGLTDRIEALGGHLHVDSPPAGGTRVMAEVALP